MLAANTSPGSSTVASKKKPCILLGKIQGLSKKPGNSESQGGGGLKPFPGAMSSTKKRRTCLTERGIGPVSIHANEAVPTVKQAVNASRFTFSRTVSLKGGGVIRPDSKRVKRASFKFRHRPASPGNFCRSRRSPLARRLRLATLGRRATQSGRSPPSVRSSHRATRGRERRADARSPCSVVLPRTSLASRQLRTCGVSVDFAARQAVRNGFPYGRNKI